MDLSRGRISSCDQTLKRQIDDSQNFWSVGRTGRHWEISGTLLSLEKKLFSMPFVFFLRSLSQVSPLPNTTNIRHIETWPLALRLPSQLFGKWILSRNPDLKT